MKQVNVYEAKTHLSRLLTEAMQGEEIIIARDGVPLVRLTPVSSPARPRLLGCMRGKITIHDDFDDPLEEFAEYS